MTGHESALAAEDIERVVELIVQLCHELFVLVAKPELSLIESGADSLMAVELQVTLEQELGCQVELAALLEAESIWGLALQICQST